MAMAKSTAPTICTVEGFMVAPNRKAGRIIVAFRIGKAMPQRMQVRAVVFFRNPTRPQQGMGGCQPVGVWLRLPRVALEKITAQADNCPMLRNHYLAGLILTHARSKAPQNQMKGKIMEAVLEEVEKTLPPTPVKARAPLSKEELERRRYNIDFARANVELEGFPTDGEYREMEERYARGEIDAEDLDKYMDERLEARIHAIHGK
jgi:hypothetical protein